MSENTQTLPPDVLAALAEGETIAAIKLLRERTGLGLKEAKEVIDQHLSGNPVALAAGARVGMGEVPLPATVVAALQGGNKIEAIRLLREATGLGLKEAKDVIDASSNSRGRVGEELSPGQVATSGKWVWGLLALVAVCVAAYVFLTGGS